MAEKKQKKPNRFVTNHPPVDANDPAVLITAGLIGPQNGEIEPQDAPEAEGAVTTPAEPETKQEPPVVAEAEPVTEPKAEAPAPEEEAGEEQTVAPALSILEDLIPKEKKPTRDTYGFYLDKDVHDELLRLTKQSKAKNKSVFLNALLRRVFFGE